MKYLFGPVASRRLGLSLGIDLIPYKTCSFDCIYCELGKTTAKTISRKEYIPRHSIIKEIREYLEISKDSPDYITLGGSGEPTLNSQTGTIIKEIKRLTSIPVAVLTNGSLLYQDEVKEDLLAADLVVPSLDAVSPHIFQDINRPHPSLQIKEIMQGLEDFSRAFKGQIWLEILFSRTVNDDKAEIDKMREAVSRIAPDKIQLSTVFRPPAENFAFAVTRERLVGIKEIIGEKAEIVGNFSRLNLTASDIEGESRILNLLKRRPSTLEDMLTALGIHRNELVKDLGNLRDKEKIEYYLYNNQGYYQAKKAVN